ncbi:hypothetical protein EZV73_03875 [Acidaminobacter sp. JC074]|uniref:hypothetical protein n=1 Tax=Acidaminobacter sp. JC074 TaxID=2530199 RepID=UPI001F0FD1F5|nr:hypothetical protein [Acidaminobacter sp. JC074]MCH4886689.1 hypothetical protein [Acidaminobacter sp. JC074]
MKKYTIKEYIVDLFIGFGFILLISPAFLYWFIHGSYDRYVWLLSGPDPFNKLGGGPYQLFLFMGLFSSGVIISILAIWSKLKSKK